MARKQLSNIDMNGKKLTGLPDASASGEAVNYGQNVVTDNISENTGGHGVVIDGLTVKDGGLISPALSAPVVSGGIKSLSGAVVALHNNATGFYAYPQTTGVYIVSTWYAAGEANCPYMATAIVVVDTGTNHARVAIAGNGSDSSITIINQYICVTQLSGITLTMNYSILRLV